MIKMPNKIISDPLTSASDSMIRAGPALRARQFAEDNEKKQQRLKTKKKKKTQRRERLVGAVASCCSTIQDWLPLSAAKWSSEPLYSCHGTLSQLVYSLSNFSSESRAQLFSFSDASALLPLFMGFGK